MRISLPQNGAVDTVPDIHDDLKFEHSESIFWLEILGKGLFGDRIHSISSQIFGSVSIVTLFLISESLDSFLGPLISAKYMYFVAKNGAFLI